MAEGGKIVMVQGASRGIGLEFVRQLRARPDVAAVIASCRSPDTALELNRQQGNASLLVVGIDVQDEASIRAAAQTVAGQHAHLDLLINCAGLLHDTDGMGPERRLDDLDPQALLKSFAVNGYGPALVVKHFRSLLQRAGQPVVASLSARVGSIGDNRLGGWYAYRAAKAAQNMLTRCMAIELGRGSRKVIVVALHPGTVDTDLSRPFQSNVPEGKLFSRERSVRQLLDVIDGLEPGDSGHFFAWDGSEIPW